MGGYGCIKSEDWYGYGGKGKGVERGRKLGKGGVEVDRGGVQIEIETQIDR
jgi:hypothetical protein